jgi:methylmalonyl-CoA mutase C-terminal domain/subunit
MPRKIRVLVGKPGLDGHDRGAKVVAAALRDAGMEVIYTGLHQSPDQIVEAALQEDVDVVALSILSGAHMTLFPEVMERMKKKGIGDKLLTGGGIIPPEDMSVLARQGVGRLFGPGSSTQDIAVYIREWFEARGQDASVAAPRAATSTRRAAPAAASRTARKPAVAARSRSAAAPSRRATPRAGRGTRGRAAAGRKR